jgi:Ca2+-binding RTX toxin-like protein
MSASQQTFDDTPRRVDAPQGPAGNNRIVGTAGPDTIYGGNGNDVLLGYGGNDVLAGEPGRDRLFGMDGNDRLIGGTENDILSGGAGADAMYGQLGNDVYVVENPSDVVFEAADQGNDRVVALIDYTLPANVEDLIMAGPAPVDGVGNELRNLIYGNAGDRNIANRLTGGAGDDDLYGRDGDDILIGQDGNDRHFAGAGNDLMAGGLGNDRYYLEGSADRIVENADEGIDRVYTAESYALQVDLEQLFLQGSGNVNAAGNAADNYLRGNPGDNRLDGGDGNDVLAGQEGSDRLIGGLGADDQRGATGADVFVFRSVEDTPAGAGRDLIRDFVPGEDVLNLGLVDANALVAGDQQFTYIGNAAFSGTAGELRYDGGILRGDVNGDAVEELQINLLNNAALTQDDLVL